MDGNKWRAQRVRGHLTGNLSKRAISAGAAASQICGIPRGRREVLPRGARARTASSLLHVEVTDTSCTGAGGICARTLRRLRAPIARGTPAQYSTSSILRQASTPRDDGRLQHARSGHSRQGAAE